MCLCVCVPICVVKNVTKGNWFELVRGCDMLASEKCKRISFYKATFLKACWRNCKAKQLSFKENLCLGRDSTLYLLCIFKFMVKIWSFWFFGIGFFSHWGHMLYSFWKFCTANGCLWQLKKRVGYEIIYHKLQRISKGIDFCG